MEGGVSTLGRAFGCSITSDVSRGPGELTNLNNCDVA